MFNTLLQLIKYYKWYAFVLAVVMLFAALAEAFGLSMILPLLSGLIGQESQGGNVLNYVDFIFKSFTPEEKIIYLLAFLVVVFFLKSVLLILHKGMSAHFAMKLREQWSSRILSNYLKSEYQSVIGQKQGIMIHNVATEPFRASKGIVLLLDLLSKLIIGVAIFIMLVVVNWQVALISAVVGGVIFYLIRNRIFNYSLKFGKERLDIHQNIGAVTAESIRAVKEIKMLGKEKRYSSALMDKLIQFTRVQTRFSIFNSLPDNLLEFVIIVLIAIVIGYIQLSSSLNTKELLPILGFFILVGQRFFKHISFVITQRMKFTSALPSLQLIHSLIHKSVPQENLEKGEHFEKLEGDIVFRNIDFSYDGFKPVFRNLNLRILKNKITALVGASGLGKSTIADLLMRLLTPESGTIEVSKKDIQDFNLVSWRNKIAYVSQDPYLFNMTLRENILLGKPEASEEELINSAKMANIHDFIISLPNGYNTMVGDRGVKLSGGQRQRIVIARAIIMDPELFIFDEATSALDREAEAAIQKSIEKLSEQKTVVVIAHRPSTIENSDVVCDLGRLVNV